MRLLLLPPRLAVVPGRSGGLLARLAHALHHVVPAAALLVAADRRHRSVDLVGQRDVVRLGPGAWWMRIRFQAILRLWPTTARFCCQPQRHVVAPVLVEALLDERAVLVVREALARSCRRWRPACRAYLSSPVASHGVDQVGRDVVADRVPVLARPVAAQRRRSCGRTRSGRGATSSRRRSGS